MIVGILEDPASHRGKIYPLFGPVEFTYREIAQVLSRVLGKDVEYKQVDFEDDATDDGRLRENPQANSVQGHYGDSSSPSGAAATTSCSSTCARSRSITRTASSRARMTSSRRSEDGRR